MKKIILFVFIILSANLCQAKEEVGEITQFWGTIKVSQQENIRHEKIVDKSNYKLFVKDIVKAKRVINGKDKSKAFIKFIDENKIVLQEGAILNINGIENIDIEKGKVLFSIRRKKGLKGIVVKTKSVVIGVKGTKFMVDASGDKVQVFLKEGNLNIQSLKGDFVRYKNKKRDEFEDFKNDGFEGYKKQMEEEFREFVKDFDMKAGTAVSIDGLEARDIKITDEINKKFEDFKKFQ